jgi:membrane-bound metal-dependent hydrolase YbcI (DUF457 family)
LDNLTHSLFGLTLARTPLGRAGRGTTAALLLASNAPDIDVALAAGGPQNYLRFHRGPTHGPLGILGLSLVVAGLVCALRRRLDRRTSEPGASVAMLWIVSMVGMACHVLMDLPTTYGTRALSPFSWVWFGFDWMPIVDVYLLAILAGALWFGRGAGADPGSAARSRRNAALALFLMAANYGVRAMSHRTAIDRAPEVFGRRLPGWCAQSVRPSWEIDRWPRQTGAPAPHNPAGSCLVELAAIPDFVSPFKWRMVAQLSNGYELCDLDLLAGGDGSGEGTLRRTLAARIPNVWTPGVFAAAGEPTARIFLGFSRFPAARSFVAQDGTTTVRWNDVRFMMGSLTEPRQFRGNLFGATVIRAPDGMIRADRLGP